MNDLVLCPSCTRHVRRKEERCPFCGTALSEELRRAVPRRAPPGLSRAKLYAIHAVVATSVATGACGGATTATHDGGTPADATVSDAVASDGQSPQPDASGGGTPDSAADSSAGADTGAEGGVDASIADTGPEHDGWGPPPPPYGCVFPEGCGDVKV